jgi:hypothetical protein
MPENQYLIDGLLIVGLPFTACSALSLNVRTLSPLSWLGMGQSWNKVKKDQYDILSLRV